MPTITSEMIWIKSLLATVGIFLEKPMRLFCDNQATIHIAKNPLFHGTTKHIEITCHFVRERILYSNLVMCYVPSIYQVVDIFTKALGSQQFLFLRGKLDMINSYAPP